MRTHILTRDGLTYRVKLAHWFPRWFMRHDAIAWNRTVYYRGARMSPALHCHEFQHLLQQRHDGLWRFTFRYVVDALRFGYRGIAYEREAYAIEEEQDVVASFNALS